MIKQRTVRFTNGERVTIQRDNPYGRDRFFVEVHDGQRNAWAVTTRAGLLRIRAAIDALVTTPREGTEG